MPRSIFLTGRSGITTANADLYSIILSRAEGRHDKELRYNHIASSGLECGDRFFSQAVAASPPPMLIYIVSS